MDDLFSNPLQKPIQNSEKENLSLLNQVEDKCKGDVMQGKKGGIVVTAAMSTAGRLAFRIEKEK